MDINSCSCISVWLKLPKMYWPLFPRNVLPVFPPNLDFFRTMMIYFLFFFFCVVECKDIINFWVSFQKKLHVDNFWTAFILIVTFPALYISKWWCKKRSSVVQYCYLQKFHQHSVKTIVSKIYRQKTENYENLMGKHWKFQRFLMYWLNHLNHSVDITVSAVTKTIHVSHFGHDVNYLRLRKSTYAKNI